MKLEDYLAQVKMPDQQAMDLAQSRWNGIAKPLNGLGLLEKAVIKIAGIIGDARISLQKKAVVVFCADNGVVCEGVTQTGSEVTAIVAHNFVTGNTSVNQMANVANADVIPVDAGMLVDLKITGILSQKLGYGTQNIANAPAMSKETAERGLLYGIRLAERLKQQGYRLLATGEMGIGNTTTSSAVASVLLNRPVEEMTGKGAGLSLSGWKRKVAVIQTAITRHAPNPNDPLEVVAALGGFDLVQMAGLFLGGAVYQIPVVIDGFISAVAALAAARICPQAKAFLLASHLSSEPAARMVLEELDLNPILHGEFCLGEGTGAVALFPLLDMAVAVYENMSTFSSIGIEDYKPL